MLREPRFVLREVVRLSGKCAIIRVSYIHIAFRSVTISQLASTYRAVSVGHHVEVN